MKDLIRVTCFVTPKGEALWFESDAAYLREVISKWKNDNPEFKDTKCTSGAVEVVMPRENYQRIMVHYGGDNFKFPKAGAAQ